MTATPRDASATIVPLGRNLGAELRGVDLTRGITPPVIAAIKRAFWANPVLVLRNQRDLGPEQLIEFGNAFGYIAPHSILQYRHPKYEQLSYVTNVKPDGSLDEYGYAKRATDWHADGVFKAKPDCMTFLYSIAAPSVGGHTEFTNMYLAYETLPEDLRRRADGLACFHKRGKGWRCTAPPPPLTEAQKATGEFEGNVHPLVITHPESGRRSLYISAAHTSYIVGLERKESDALLDRLYGHAIQPEFQYHHKWQVGDLLMWDQRCTMHRAGGGAPRDEKRIMMRGMIVAELDAKRAAA
ncbi:MAG: TauD/TfdA family dioxygenase [Alphaproteobacteria bacterium]|nr:TauD/TfdA family dioxygenase [Alphaproteobacteria bacterium]